MLGEVFRNEGRGLELSVWWNALKYNRLRRGAAEEWCASNIWGKDEDICSSGMGSKSGRFRVFAGTVCSGQICTV